MLLGCLLRASAHLFADPGLYLISPSKAVNWATHLYSQWHPTWWFGGRQADCCQSTPQCDCQSNTHRTSLPPPTSIQAAQAWSLNNRDNSSLHIFNRLLLAKTLGVKFAIIMLWQTRSETLQWGIYFNHKLLAKSCQLSNPPLLSGTQLGGLEIGKWIVVSQHHSVTANQILTELLCHRPFQSKQLKLEAWIIGGNSSLHILRRPQLATTMGWSLPLSYCDKHAPTPFIILFAKLAFLNASDLFMHWKYLCGR